MAYAILNGFTTGGSFAVKAYEVEDVKPVKDIYEFKIVKPMFGSYFAVKSGVGHWTDKNNVVESIEELKSKVKEMMIHTAFQGESFHNLVQTVKQMNKV